MTLRIPRKTIYSAVLFFMIYIITFVRFEYFPYYDLMRYVFIALSALFILLNFRKVFKKKYLKINIFLLLFSAAVIFSSWKNIGITKIRNPFLSSIVFCAAINLAFYSAEYAIETDHVRLMVRVFFLFCTFNNVITDVLLLLIPKLYATHSEYYFIGNKFTVVFAHCLMTTLFLCMNKSGENMALKSFIWFLMLVWTLIIAIIVDCATGIIGCFVLGALLLIQFFGKSLCKRNIFIIAAAFSLTFPLIYAIFVSIPIIKPLLAALGRDTTMTDRQRLYGLIGVYLLNKPIFGYGYGTSFELGMKMMGFPDTQNCFFEWIWQSGIVGTSLLVLALLAVISVICKYSTRQRAISFEAITALFFTFLLLGAVEITINEMFFGVAAVMLAVGLSELSDNPDTRSALKPKYILRW